MILIEYSEWANGWHWDVLSRKVNRLVSARKFRNICFGGSTIKSNDIWVKVVEAIDELRKENEND